MVDLESYAYNETLHFVIKLNDNKFKIEENNDQFRNNCTSEYNSNITLYFNKNKIANTMSLVRQIIRIFTKCWTFTTIYNTSGFRIQELTYSHTITITNTF